jgi:hypothetical protein
MKITLEGTDFEIQFRRLAERSRSRIVNSARSALNQARDEIRTAWAQDVARAGNFGQRWVNALTITIDPPRGRSLNLIMTVRMVGISYWRIHEYGGTIHGRPLLWIPLPWTGLKMRAREYGRRYGLFRVDRKSGGNPLLLSIRDAEPKYVGVESVTLRKRFHLRSIIRRSATNIRRFYRNAIRSSH